MCFWMNSELVGVGKIMVFCLVSMVFSVFFYGLGCMIILGFFFVGVLLTV